MVYSAEQIEELLREKNEVLHKLNEIRTTLFSDLSQTLKSERAREYLLHGVCRRLGIIRRSMANVFDIFPVSREELLSDDERCNLGINLHAFFINVYGILDNVAWVFVFENSLENEIKGGRQGVGLFSERTIKHFPQRIQDYLKTEKIKGVRYIFR